MQWSCILTGAYGSNGRLLRVAANFSLDLPDEKPVVIGDFLDEAPPPVVTRRAVERQSEPAAERMAAPSQFQPVIVRGREEEVGETRPWMTFKEARFEYRSTSAASSSVSIFDSIALSQREAGPSLISFVCASSKLSSHLGFVITSVFRLRSKGPEVQASISANRRLVLAWPSRYWPVAVCAAGRSGRVLMRGPTFASGHSYWSPYMFRGR